MTLKLGTRGSDLALTQSQWVADALIAAGAEIELSIISTSGDRSSAPTFGAIGPQGVFVREIEQALIAGSIDLAVHSFKDLPTTSPDGLVIAAVPARRDPADWLFVRRNPEWSLRGQTQKDLTPGSLTELPDGARVGTSSARRAAWLRHFNTTIDIQPLRGNVPTRLRRLADGDFDAILLAGAGVARLTEGSDVLEAALDEIQTHRLDPQQFVPAPAQGALAVQCRAGDTGVRALLATIDDAPARAAVELERRALVLAEGGCDTAFGAYAEPHGEGFALNIMLEREARILSAAVTGDIATGVEALAFERLAPRHQVAS